MSAADRLSSVLRWMAMGLLGLSALPMLFLTLGLLAMTGRQCSPHSATHSIVDQLGTLGVVLVMYALPFVGSIVLMRAGRPVWWKRALAFCAAGLALLFSLFALVAVSISTMC